MISGLERQRVKLGSVGKITENYQQSLHRLFFGCNAPVQYRGIREKRKYFSLDAGVIDSAELKLHNMLMSKVYTYKDTAAMKYGNHRAIYMNISDIKNVTRRLLYNVLLYHIAYYLEKDTLFKSDAHFYGSMIYNLHTNIENIYIRTTKMKLPMQKSIKYNIPSKQYYWILQQLESIISPILSRMC